MSIILFFNWSRSSLDMSLQINLKRQYSSNGLAMLSSAESRKPDDVVAHDLIASQSSNLGLTTMEVARHVTTQNYRNFMSTEDKERTTNTLRNKLPKMLRPYSDIEYSFGPTSISIDEGKKLYVKEQKGWRKVKQCSEPLLTNEEVRLESLPRTPDLEVLLTELKMTLDEVKIITKPKTKAAHLEDLQRKLFDFCHYSGEWNQPIRLVVKDLFSYMEKDFEDLRYSRTYLDMLLCILRFRPRNDPIVAEIKTRFVDRVEAMWCDDAALDPKENEPVLRLLIALLLHFHSFDLAYVTTLVDYAINKRWRTERFWVVYNAVAEYAIPELLKQEGGAKEQIRAFMIKEEDDTEGRDEDAFERAKKFKELFHQSLNWQLF
jgi:hypothetical protein